MNSDPYLLSRKRMVAEQIAARGIRDGRLLTALESVPRHCFVQLDDLAWAYSDGPLPIGYGQTISQPYIVALMTELLDLKGTECVLEVGTGSGYQAAVLGKMAREVHTLEVIPQLAALALETLSGLGFANVHVHAADGSLGWPEASPYDGILVAAAAPSVPQPLLEQLAADGGRLVIPIGSRGYQKLETWTRRGKEYEHQINISVAFVPLRGKLGWS
ncbi:MAG: protein-L-isoaspartate(D-aspartate) O-methyltransferase [Anaerolineales bacterium]|jgi:protein-L-isoaspartate(D-aspartate) O-methyltransferase